jgi:low temperature requirement protein LtrA
VIVWAWVLYALYANRFDTDDLIFRLAKPGAMLAIAAVAVDVPRVVAGDGGTVSFAAAYVVLRTFLIALYIRSRYHLRGEGRTLSDTYIVGYSSTTGLWLVSIVVPGPFRYVLGVRRCSSTSPYRSERGELSPARSSSFHTSRSASALSSSSSWAKPSCS